MLSVVLAVVLFVVAAFAALAALVGLTRNRVLLRSGSMTVVNRGMYAASAGVIAAALAIEGFGELDESSVNGLAGSLVLLAGLAGLLRSRTQS